jgi:hypothetical protein
MIGAKRADTVLVVGGAPRADLLPPEVKAAEKARGQRRWLALIVVLAVAVVVTGNLLAWLNATGSEIRLEEANERTASILLEQQKYSEARVLSDRVALAEDARVAALATEIDWKGYLDRVQSSLPAGTALTEVTATIAEPAAQAEEEAKPLGASSVAGIDFVATSSTLPDVSQWIDNLGALPGFVGAAPGSISLNDDGTYRVAIAMRMNDMALANRFVEIEVAQ